MRTILYVRASAPSETLADLAARAAASGVSFDETVCEEAGFDMRTAFAARPIGARLLETLSRGETLVVERFGDLGARYFDLCDALFALMRRGVVVKTLVDGLSFDGATRDPARQAARDALIAFLAAQSEKPDDRPSRPPTPKRPRVDDDGDPASARQSMLLQARIFAAHIAVLGFVVYGVMHAAPVAVVHAPRLGAPVSDDQHSGIRPVAAPDWGRFEAAPALEGRSGVADIPAPTAPEPALNLTPDAQRRIFARVARWRSARVRDADFPTRVGATVPAARRLATFPYGLVVQTPALRAYKFLVVNEQVAVIEPETRKIVALVSGG